MFKSLFPHREKCTEIANKYSLDIYFYEIQHWLETKVTFRKPEGEKINFMNYKLYC